MITEMTAELAREHLTYNAETGQLFWRVAKQGRQVGRLAGCVNGAGYVCIRINQRMYLAHRLAWLIVHGHYPPEHIDHINGRTDDNRLTNLREATRSMNLHNRDKSKNNTTGYKGVMYYKNIGKFTAQLCSNGKRIYLGLFDCPESAHAAYVKKDIELHGQFARLP